MAQCCHPGRGKLSRRAAWEWPIGRGAVAASSGDDETGQFARPKATSRNSSKRRVRRASEIWSGASKTPAMAGSADAEDQGQSVETQSVRRREARAVVTEQKCKRETGRGRAGQTGSEVWSVVLQRTVEMLCYAGWSADIGWHVVGNVGVGRHKRGEAHAARR